MGAFRLVCLLAIPFFLFQHIDGQPVKMPADWNIQIASVYPNPMINDTNCMLQNGPMRICDPNKVLNSTLRIRINEILLQIENQTFLQNVGCTRNVIVVVAMMMNIGPSVADNEQEANSLAEKFRELWNLDRCSAVIVASINSRTFILNMGEILNRSLLPLDVTCRQQAEQGQLEAGPEALLICVGEEFKDEIERKIKAGLLTTSEPYITTDEIQRQIKVSLRSTSEPYITTKRNVGTSVNHQKNGAGAALTYVIPIISMLLI